MHPFGGTPICPRCSKAVYAAEQIMGPGRKLYHKPCLSCTTCRKRLDSYNLVEHNSEPYCKNCHVKSFGTRDLRHANLPDRDDVHLSPPTSPGSTAISISQSPPNMAPLLPPRREPISNPSSETPRVVSPIFRPTHAYRPSKPSNDSKPLDSNGTQTPPKDQEDWEPPVMNGGPSNTGRGANGLPRTVPLTSTVTGGPRATSPSNNPPPETAPATNAVVGGRMSVPLTPLATGTRYGAALAGVSAPLSPMSTGKQWGGGTPKCGKCGKSVYFAEQVKAIGKTYHKGCLRCTSCNTSLDSTRLNENEGSPFCNRCYNKLHGPRGNGYALLGKAGG